MTTRAGAAVQQYPAKYFPAAASYFVWNSLTAHDVHHTLQSRPGFEGQNLYFVLNHPIKFVRLVGLIVDVELLGNGKYLILCIDDGSGSTIECKTEVRQIVNQDEATGMSKVKDEWPSTTLMDNLDAFVTFGDLRLQIDKQPVDIGTVAKVKGTVYTFRQQRQLKLERIRVVKDTDEEAKAWRETAAWKTDVLSRPWVLTDAERDEIDMRLARDKALEAEKFKKKRAHDAKYTEKKRRHEEKKEKKRRHLEGAFDQGALTRSGVLPDRVTDS